MGSERENNCSQRVVGVTLEVSGPFQIDEGKCGYLEGPGDILKFRVLLECIRNRSKKQQNVPLLRFCHGRSPMFVPVRRPQKSIHEPIAKPRIPVQ